MTDLDLTALKAALKKPAQPSRSPTMVKVEWPDEVVLAAKQAWPYGISQMLTVALAKMQEMGLAREAKASDYKGFWTAHEEQAFGFPVLILKIGEK